MNPPPAYFRPKETHLPPIFPFCRVLKGLGQPSPCERCTQTHVRAHGHADRYTPAPFFTEGKDVHIFPLQGFLIGSWGRGGGGRVNFVLLEDQEGAWKIM